MEEFCCRCWENRKMSDKPCCGHLRAVAGGRGPVCWRLWGPSRAQVLLLHVRVLARPLRPALVQLLPASFLRDCQLRWWRSQLVLKIQFGRFAQVSFEDCLACVIWILTRHHTHTHIRWLYCFPFPSGTKSFLWVQSWLLMSFTQVGKIYRAYLE